MSRIVTLDTRATGTNFALVGVVRDRRGRKIAETAPVPYGMESAALGAARRLAASKGWTVAGDDCDADND